MAVSKFDGYEGEILEKVAEELSRKILERDGTDVTLLSCEVLFDSYYQPTMCGIIYRDSENRRKTVSTCVT